VFDATNTPDNLKILIGGDPTMPGLAGVGSDVGIGNAEICSVTADSSKKFR
jgi:hypothetical protein